VTVLGDGGELGIALEFPMRYLVNGPPVVKVNGENATYEFINGTFEYDVEQQTYSTTNATLIVYNTTAGSNMVEIGFEGSLLGKSDTDIDTVYIGDAFEIAMFDAQRINSFTTYDYPDVTRDGYINIVDAFEVARYDATQTNEYYQ